MSRIWCVVKREYLENVRTKAFLVGIVLTPIWMGLIFVIPALASSAGVKAQEVVIVDETGVLLDGRHVDSCASQCGGRSARRDEASAVADDGLRQVDDVRLVVHGDQSGANRSGLAHLSRARAR